MTLFLPIYRRRIRVTAECNHLVDFPALVGTPHWVDVPDGEDIAQLSNSPVTRIWTEEEDHVTGCEISPVATYQIRATIDGGNTFSAPLAVETSPLPSGGNFGVTQCGRSMAPNGRRHKAS